MIFERVGGTYALKNHYLYRTTQIGMLTLRQGIQVVKGGTHVLEVRVWCR